MKILTKAVCVLCYVGYLIVEALQRTAVLLLLLLIMGNLALDYIYKAKMLGI